MEIKENKSKNGIPLLQSQNSLTKGGWGQVRPYLLLQPLIFPMPGRNDRNISHAVQRLKQ